MCTYDSKEFSSKLDPVKFKPLFQIKPLFHAAAIFYNWLLIGFVIYLNILFTSFWLYVLSIVVIGARMHALAILMHDASHFRFLKNRKWNDWITNITIMYPIFTSIEKYRNNHLAHHQHLNTDHDPDWVAKLDVREFTFPKSKTEFMITVLSYLVFYQGILDVFWFLKRFGGAPMKQYAGTESKPLKIGFYIFLFGALTFFGGWKYWFLFWIVPWLTTFFMFQYIRSVAEHFGDLARDHELNSSRTVKTSFIERFFIAPHNVGYHLEHHLFPGVPFYNLPKLHRLLMEQNDYSENAHITQGYTTGLFNEFSRSS
ncbi:MAG: fatty acid desaturase family protein [Saprospiraceae bacterium]